MKEEENSSDSSFSNIHVKNEDLKKEDHSDDDDATRESDGKVRSKGED